MFANGIRDKERAEYRARLANEAATALELATRKAQEYLANVDEEVEPDAVMALTGVIVRAREDAALLSYRGMRDKRRALGD